MCKKLSWFFEAKNISNSSQLKKNSKKVEGYGRKLNESGFWFILRI
eukprot:UN12492